MEAPGAGTTCAAYHSLPSVEVEVPQQQLHSGCSQAVRVEELKAGSNRYGGMTSEDGAESSCSGTSGPREATLIPGLRDDALALQCLARVPRASHSTLKSVCRAWKRAVTSRELFQLRHDLGLQDHWIYVSFCLRFLGDLCASAATTGSSNGNSNGHGRCAPSIPPLMRTAWITAYDPGFNVWHPVGAVPGLRDGEILKGQPLIFLSHTGFQWLPLSKHGIACMIVQIQSVVNFVHY